MYKDQLGVTWYKVGLHIHTTLSDGRVSPQEMAAIYKEAGFDAVAITDHWKYYPEDEIDGLRIISGCEYNLGGADTAQGVMHIVGIGMREDPKIIRENTTYQQTIDAITAAGGMAVLAHPAWSLNTKDDIKPLRGFSLLEIYNTVSDVHQSCRPYSGYIVDALANDGITYPLIATDDTHYYDGTDETKSFIMVKAKSGSVADILDAIRQKEFYASQGPELYIRRNGRKISLSCSECNVICFITNASWAAGRIVRGKDLTCAEYEMKDFEKWVRVEIADKNGKYAWSSIITL